MINPEVTGHYYFYPRTQTYSTQLSLEEPSVHVKVSAAPKDLSGDRLTEVINRLGNYMALISLRLISSDTKSNYCDDFTKHAGTCDQDYWRYCKRHFTNEEMAECLHIEKQLEPLSLTGIHYDMQGFHNIRRGEIDKMRRILDGVRRAFQKATDHENVKNCV
jgi:hypothetical protein